MEILSTMFQALALSNRKSFRREDEDEVEVEAELVGGVGENEVEVEAVVVDVVKPCLVLAPAGFTIGF